MPTDIDDIFASKAKAKAIQPIASPSTTPEKRKKSTKKKCVVETAKTVNEVTTKKRAIPETVVDPSSHLPSSKRVKVSVTTASKRLSKHGTNNANGDEDWFKDSRGSGPRK